MNSGISLFEKANQLHEAGKYVEAEKLYDDLLTQNPDNSGLLATVGTLYLRMNKFGLAISLLERAAKDKADSEVYCNLGVAYKNAGLYKKCSEWFAKAVKVNPTANVLATYSSLYVNVGNPDKAIQHAERAIKKDPNCAMAHWNLSIGRLERGDFKEGWAEHDWGYKNGLRVDRGANLVPEWDGKSPGRIWIFGEQGLGDEIMFASMLPDVLKTNEVLFECHQRLETLFAKSFPTVKCIGTREDSEIPWIKDEKLDWRISVSSLGKFYRNSKFAFPGTPYLKAEPLPSGEKFRVGISWTGGLKLGRVRVRSVPLPMWAGILGNDCEFVSLQYTDEEAALQEMERNGYSIDTPPEAKAHEYNETARLVASCDLVISVCTSVVHLAGALGVPCWVMTPSKPAWRYGVSGRMPWYKSVRLYRQQEGNDWKPIIDRISMDLSDILLERQRKSA